MRLFIFCSLILGFTFNSFSQSWQMVDLVSHNTTRQALTDAVFFGDTGIVMGSAGSIYRSDNFFQSFTIDSTYQTKHFDGISFPTRSTGYITCPDVRGGLLKTIDGGNNWQPMSTGIIGSNWGDILNFISVDTGYGASSTIGFLEKTRNAGVSWYGNPALALLEYRIFGIQFPNDSTGFLLCNNLDLPVGNGSDNIHILKSVDYGNTWNEIAFRRNKGIADFYFTDDTTVILSSDVIILKSTDGGYNFDTVMTSNDYYTDGYSFHIHAISFANRDTGFVAFGGSVYRTYDAGNSWTRTDFIPPSDITFIKALSPSKVVVGCSTGNIYITETGGGVWSGIKETEQENNLLLYPNPSTSQLIITTTNATRNATVTITTTTGSTVMQTNLANESKNEIEVSKLAAGLYYLILQDEKGRVVRRFVKSN